MQNIETLLCAIEDGPVDEQGLPLALKDLDRSLAEAARQDMCSLLSKILSHLGRRKCASAHGYRTRQILSCFGWIPVRYAYIRKAGHSAFLDALDVTAKCTVSARDWIVRCAALCGSFAEGRNMLRRLTGIDISVSKLRNVALAFGEQCLIAQNHPKADVRSYSQGPLDRWDSGVRRHAAR